MFRETSTQRSGFARFAGFASNFHEFLPATHGLLSPSSNITGLCQAIGRTFRSFEGEILPWWKLKNA
jgi:hypothetical protein